jgi:hypothetical protein
VLDGYGSGVGKEMVRATLLKRALLEWDGQEYAVLEVIYTRLLGHLMYVRGGMR